MSRPTREDLRAQVEAYLERAAEDRELPINVRAICRSIEPPCSPQTLYNHDEPLAEEHRLTTLIKDAKEKRTAAPIRTRRRRSPAADAERIARLQAALEKAQRDHQDLLTRMILVEAALRGHPDIDLDEIYETGLEPPDRSQSKAGKPRIPSRFRASS